VTPPTAPSKHLTPARIALFYVLVSIIWIVVSSELLYLEFEHPVAITTFEILKGILFVGLSGGLIFWICKRALERLLKQRELLRESEAERQELALQLVQAQKLEGIGRLAGGIAHDFNNILTVILSSCHLLRGDAVTGPAQVRVSMIETAAERAASLTRQLLAFSRHQVLEIDSLNINPVITDSAQLLEKLLGEDVRLAATLDPELGNIMADPTQISQILMNLAVNARDAMPKGGTLEILTANLEVTKELAARVPDLKPGAAVVLTVRDTGVGIPDEIRSRVFEPFFTTKEPGKGTGLGLSTVYGIVRQSGGAIDLRSAPGQGATFRIYFPRTALPTAGERKPATVSARPGSETILVVDDDVLVLETVSEHLRDLGYYPLMAQSPKEALELSRVHKERIDVLLTDLVMPEMTGPQLRREVERWRPLIQTLYMTGYSSDRVPIAEIERSRLVRKPFTADSLSAGIRRVLDTQVQAGN
jgi:two-component system cell cycle sensor histidine kinase/response regulator CckA